MRKYIAGDLAIPRDAGVGAVQRDRTRTLIRGLILPLGACSRRTGRHDRILHFPVTCVIRRGPLCELFYLQTFGPAGEATVPRSISKFVIIAVAIAVVLVGATTLGIAAAQSAFEHAKTTNPIKPSVSETDFHISHHQHVRNIFFGVDRFR